jgi:hypothetical protein
MKQYKLTIELVPQTCWYTNVRSNVTKTEWDTIRNICYDRANNICQICNDSGKNQGYKHNVECHEIWYYDDVNKIQTLTGLIALCPYCHKCKHPGLAQINGETNIVINQIMKVNNIAKYDAEKLLTEAFDLWKQRSKYNWTLDISLINDYWWKP